MAEKEDFLLQTTRDFINNLFCSWKNISLIIDHNRGVTMPQTKSRAGPGQDFQRSGANPTIFYLFLDLVGGRSRASLQWSGAGLGHDF